MKKRCNRWDDRKEWADFKPLQKQILLFIIKRITSRREENETQKVQDSCFKSCNYYPAWFIEKCNHQWVIHEGSVKSFWGKAFFSLIFFFSRPFLMLKRRISCKLWHNNGDGQHNLQDINAYACDVQTLLLLLPFFEKRDCHVNRSGCSVGQSVSGHS